eukprot:TRINITY_DN24838_c0_g1_i6.p1 TRINITY_DN24838_c0_g1~~TRINITY_DN24838_c0_g1_i6.p1  ORF type:complete len:102 (+),score=26.07 TRINITY_DN24838_c0_g1_i6:133-438(+)
MIRRPPRSTLSSSSAASDVYKRQVYLYTTNAMMKMIKWYHTLRVVFDRTRSSLFTDCPSPHLPSLNIDCIYTVSYTHLRAHETPEHLVCRLLLEKKKKKNE